jgi:hypothetical protein
MYIPLYFCYNDIKILKNTQNFYMNNTDRISKEILLELGFAEVNEEKLGNENTFGRKFDNYYWEIYVKIRTDLPKENANCGTICIYEPDGEYSDIPEDLLEKENWDEEEQKRADNFTRKINQSLTAIVWHVDTVLRLKEAIKGIVGVEL